jgi:predicted HAD superfamily phosphohydrolase YqeG
LIAIYQTKADNQTIQRAQKPNSSKINEAMKQLATEQIRTFFKGRNLSTQKTHEKTLTIPGHKGDRKSKPH